MSSKVVEVYSFVPDIINIDVYMAPSYERLSVGAFKLLIVFKLILEISLFTFSLCSLVKLKERDF